MGFKWPRHIPAAAHALKGCEPTTRDIGLIVGLHELLLKDPIGRIAPAASDFEVQPFLEL